MSKSEIIEKVLTQLNIKHSDCHTGLIVQRIMPYSKEKSVIVIPKITERDEETFSCDSYILVINNETGDILNKFHESNAWISDAVRIAKISIDFAPYSLNSTTRAFGIKVLYEGDSRPNPFENEEMSLFIPQGDSLAKVLKNFSVFLISGEWDTNCEGQIITEKKVLVMSDKKTNEYCDIIVKNRITTTNKSIVNGECRDVDTIENKIIVLNFEDKEYK